MGKIRLFRTHLLCVENIGRGPAININAEYSVTPNGGTRKWHHPILSPKEYQRFSLPIPGDDAYSKNLFEKYKAVIVKFDYSDLYKEKHNDKTVIDLEKFKKGIEGGGVMYEEPLIDHIKKIKDHLDKISKSVDNLSRLRER